MFRRLLGPSIFFCVSSAAGGWLVLNSYSVLDGQLAVIVDKKGNAVDVRAPGVYTPDWNKKPVIYDVKPQQYLCSGEEVTGMVAITYRPHPPAVKEIHSAFGPDYPQKIFPIAGRESLTEVLSAYNGRMKQDELDKRIGLDLHEKMKPLSIVILNARVVLPTSLTNST
ncbi:hypothetical protein PROFUN_01338 [Planoprotostelium fungivorum]|uniref:Uncharacterized protein n=1 Tax=Planoprotostelium fungivorum TaxID=1890364 RepID=A0A2P6NZS4_9EUKA|nr:hypothetical protein PROFUN_01338 [Planoprotostelium fungivorum]